jgi:hypothetical protein
VSDHDFVFTLRLADDAGWDEMVNDLTTSVLRHLGYTPSVLDELSGLVRAGFANEKDRAAGAEYDLGFRAHEGQIEIVVHRDEQTVFHTSRRLP